MRAAAVSLWVRAALRLPVLFFAGYFLSRGIRMDQRSAEFPDGSSMLWWLYSVPEADSAAWQLVGLPIRDATRWGAMTVWVFGYPAVTALYVVLGALLWWGNRPLAYRTVKVLMWLGVCVHGLTLPIVGMGAVWAVNSGANAPTYTYLGQRLVESYGWLLLPWAVAVLAATVAVLVFLRIGGAVAHRAFHGSVR